MKRGCYRWTPVFNRRDMLRMSSAGFGMLAMAGIADGEARASANPLAERVPHFPSRAKRVIFLFMHGGPSQVDTFDYKPLLKRDSGKPLPFSKPRVFSSTTGNLLKSPWRFRQYGASGTWVSDLFPHVARQVDDLCVINSMHGSNSRHGGALLELHTGSDTFVRPSMGSWILYGLGTENRDLPGYITICPTLTHGGVNAYNSAFLPAVFQGTPLGNASIAADKVQIPFIKNADGTPRDLQRLELDLVRTMNQRRLRETGPDKSLEARINSFELAFRMQSTAPQLQDISGESEATLRLYGVDSGTTRNFGQQCLMARRFVEQGVRFIQCTHSYKWDQHGGLKAGHEKNALEVDKPIAGLLQDLKQRGLLDETLVLWGGEFGRTPVAQGNDGRDHNPQGYTMWLAGGGVRGGLTYGATDDYGYFAAVNKVHLHDLHATILHLLGLDHTKLTYRYAGRDFRLTDIYGDVVYDLLA
ncbi:MAG: sulfatase [Planctomycetaceae bacterium]|nr:sulfatase [Planctomycetaceae bacterium]